MNNVVLLMNFVRLYGLVFFLLILVVLSGLSVGYVSYLNRLLHNQIQQELENKNSAKIEWGKLLLEHSTLTSPGNIEKVAREKLGMYVPKNSEIEVFLP